MEFSHRLLKVSGVPEGRVHDRLDLLARGISWLAAMPSTRRPTDLPFLNTSW
jgi:hypothetical protein